MPGLKTVRSLEELMPKKELYKLKRTIEASRLLRDRGYYEQSDMLYEQAHDIKEKYNVSVKEWIAFRQGI